MGMTTETPAMVQRSKRPILRARISLGNHLAGAPALARRATFNHIAEDVGNKVSLHEPDESAAAAAQSRSPSRHRELPLTGSDLEVEGMPSKKKVVQQAAFRLCKLGLTLDEISSVFDMSREGLQELMAYGQDEGLLVQHNFWP